MSAEPEYYPMPSFPTLAVRDIVESSRWYCDILGFNLVFQMLGPKETPVFIHLRWAKYADLLLVPDRSSSSELRGVGVTLNFAMGGKSIDDFFNSIVARGVPLDGPVDQPWNVRELTLQDPDGYRLTFMQPLRTDLSIEEVIEQGASKAVDPTSSISKPL